MPFISIKNPKAVVEEMELNERAASQVMAFAMTDEAGSLGDNARGDWPRDTGRSAAAIQAGDEVGDGFVAFVENLIWYAGYVTLPGGRNAWEELVDDRAEREADVFQDDLADAIAIALVADGA